jgi:transcriptional regulator with GAF, ATPase, and Fis domain
VSPDTNTLFREATIRICGSLDIGRALQETLVYLRESMPLDEIILVVPGQVEPMFRKLAHVTPSHAEVGEFSALFAVPDSSLELLLPDSRQSLDRTFTINRPSDHPIDEFVPPDLLDRWPDCSLLIAGLAELRCGVVFVAAETDRYGPEHERILHMLREPFVVAVSNALRYDEMVRLRDMIESDFRELQSELVHDPRSGVVGVDSGLREVMAMVRQVAGRDTPVLLLGETGTGKEIVAQSLHMTSLRRSGPFVAVNCGAIPETLIDSELFGHEKGAFTGAHATRRGRFERADGGTIFLDEIGELPQAAQVRLLRVLQSREIERVGGRDTIPVDVRIVAATHRDLEQMTATGQFRQDLLFRLNVFPIRIPPLRERREDIPALVNHFIDAKTREMHIPVRPGLADGALERLVAYDWPGNVRELENVIERALILARGHSLDFADLRKAETAHRSAQDGDAVEPLDRVIAHHVRRALAVSGGRISGAGGAADLLGLHPNTLRYRMKKLGLL